VDYTPGDVLARVTVVEFPSLNVAFDICLIPPKPMDSLLCDISAGTVAHAVGTIPTPQTLYRWFDANAGPDTIFLVHDYVDAFLAMQMTPTDNVLDSALLFHDPAAPGVPASLALLVDTYLSDRVAPTDLSSTAQRAIATAGLFEWLLAHGEHVGGAAPSSPLR